MPSQGLVRGVFLVLFAAFFGLNALRYQIGELGRAGPGLFPLLVSSLLAILGVAAIAQSRLKRSDALHFNGRNIALITGSLVGFVLISAHLNMTVAIVFLVLISSCAGPGFSLRRSAMIAVVLVLIAVVFQRFLGLNLRLV